MTYWFRPKRYGYGATPSNWKGWFLTAAFVGLAAGLAWLLEPGRSGSMQGLLVWYAALIAVIVPFVWIAWKKTDGTWRWRWGASGKEKVGK